MLNMHHYSIFSIHMNSCIIIIITLAYCIGTRLFPPRLQHYNVFMNSVSTKYYLEFYIHPLVTRKKKAKKKKKKIGGRDVL